jgi:hypothetical protein
MIEIMHSQSRYGISKFSKLQSRYKGFSTPLEIFAAISSFYCDFLLMGPVVQRWVSRSYNRVQKLLRQAV